MILVTVIVIVAELFGIFAALYPLIQVFRRGKQVRGFVVHSEQHTLGENTVCRVVYMVIGSDELYDQNVDLHYINRLRAGAFVSCRYYGKMPVIDIKRTLGG